MLGQRPFNVFVDEFGPGAFARMQCFQHGRRGTGVAQSNRDVAEPGFVTDSPYGAAFRPLQPGLFAPCKQLGQLDIVESVPGRKVAFGRRRGELVPRAAQLAVVAAVDPIADVLAEPRGDRSPQFNGQVGNATSRIKLVGRDNCSGRTDVDAGTTRAAMIAHRAICRKFEFNSFYYRDYLFL